MSKKKNDLVKMLQNHGILKTTSRNYGGTIVSINARVKMACGNPRILSAIVEALDEEIPQDITGLMAIEPGGLIPASIIAYMRKIHLSTFNKYPESRKLLGGHELTKDDIVAVIDDVYKSGQTIREAERHTRKTGAEVNGSYVVVLHESPQVRNTDNYLLTMDQLRV